MSVPDAFLEGLHRLQASGLDVHANDVPVIVASDVFERRCSGKTGDPRFPEQAPRYAEMVILECLVAYAGTH
jgi:hypothetical protein